MVTSGLFTNSNLAQVEYKNKTCTLLHKRKSYNYKHNPKVSPFGIALDNDLFKTANKVRKMLVLLPFGLAFQCQIKKNYKNEWTKTIAN